MALKRAHELTHEELLALKDDDVTELIELEMAFRGVVQPSPITPPVYIDIPKPTVRGYEVEGMPSMLFSTMSDAQRVHELLLKLKPMKKNYTWLESKTDFISKEEMLDISIKECTCYTSQEIDKVNEYQRKNQKLKTDYEERKKAFEEKLAKCNEVALEVKRIVGNAYQVESDKNFAVSRFEYYLSLAKNDIDIAMNFLRSGYQFKEYQWEAVNGRIEEIKAMEEVARQQAKEAEVQRQAQIVIDEGNHPEN